MRIYCETYGCTMNKGDTEIIQGYLKEGGHQIVENLDEADLAIVNTCAVKGTTMRRVLHRLKELDQMEDKKIIVAGCLPLIDLKRVENAGNFEGITSCLALDQIDEMINMINQGKTNVQALKGSTPKVNVPRTRETGVSAPTAIAEGCLSNCSYCCVKFARGRLQSFKTENILAEVKDALESGRREILLTSQDTAVYGMDDNEIQLPELLEQVTRIDERFRVRVGMMNPGFAKKIMPELLDAFDSEKIYKFLHLPVQSGNNEILRKMRRGYTVNDFLRVVEAFKDKFSDLYLATDIIVGFPGESKEAFEESCDLIEKVRPDKVNITRFAPMPGTDAAEMEQLDGREKKIRSKKLSSIHLEIAHEKNKSLVGRTMEGLVTEKGKKGGYVARLPNYKTAIVEEGSPGDFSKIRITEARPTYLMGEVVEVVE